MTAHSLVFGPGDRVTGWGLLVTDDDGVWLDLAKVVSPVWSALRTDRSVRLYGLDPRGVPTVYGPTTVPGAVTVTGIWRGDAIDVESQSPEVLRPALLTTPAPGLDDLLAFLGERADAWRLDDWRTVRGEDGRAVVQVRLLRVTAEIADWADGRRIRFVPSLAPR